MTVRFRIRNCTESVEEIKMELPLGSKLELIIVRLLIIT